MNKKYALLLIMSSFILMSGIVDLNNLFNYSNQEKPNYISKDNTPSDNFLIDPGATLGRVLFYDKNLSRNNTISCSSCHDQQFAFGDTAVVSKGVNGQEGTQ
jgi:cytochrome c peroxidase